MSKTTINREVIVPANRALDAGARFGWPMSAGVQGGDLIFLSALFAVDPATGQRWPGSSSEEAHRILTAMGEILAARGSSLAKVVKLHVFMASMLEMDGVNAVCRQFFPEPPPARTLCGVRLHGGARVEIDCVALA